ncbi:MAG: hypothetical protein WCJ82_00830 [Actinomycetota bacterium]
MATVLATVDSFDVRRGDGWLRDEAGERFYFHCITIADGTRSIDVGVTVRARRRIGLLGRDEAELLETL